MRYKEMTLKFKASTFCFVRNEWESDISFSICTYFLKFLFKICFWEFGIEITSLRRCNFRFHSDWPNKNFPLSMHPENRKMKQLRLFWICMCGKHDQGNHLIIDKPSSSLSFVFKMCSRHTKTESRRFQIALVWGAYSKSFVFMTDYRGR